MKLPLLFAASLATAVLQAQHTIEFIFQDPETSATPFERTGGYQVISPLDTVTTSTVFGVARSERTSVGASATGVYSTVDDSGGALFIARATRSGQVQFSGVESSVDVGMRFNFSGSLGMSTPPQFVGGLGSSVEIAASLTSLDGSVTYGSLGGLAALGIASFQTSPQFVFQGDLIGYSGSGPFLVTKTFEDVPLFTPLLFTFWIEAVVSGQGVPPQSFVQLDADFDSSLGLPIGSPTFGLPDGFSANSADFGIIGNVIPVPEPASSALLAGSFAGLVLLRRRR